MLPYQPPRAFGGSITGAFEGWFDNDDGSHNFLVGYLNRNLKQPQDVPIGPNNRIEPGGPDLGQPTHFLPARKTGVFLVQRAEELRAGPEAHVDADRQRPDHADPAAAAPRLQRQPLPRRGRRQHAAAPASGRDAAADPGPGGDAWPPRRRMSTTVATPLALTAWVDDDGKYSSGSNVPVRDGRSPVELTWSKYRGAGQVTFDAEKPKLQVAKGGDVDQPFSAKGTVSAQLQRAGRVRRCT